jgi:Phage tail protein
VTPVVVVSPGSSSSSSGGGFSGTGASNPSGELIAPSGAVWSNGVAIEEMYYTDSLGNETNLGTVLDRQFKEGLNGRFMPSFEHFSDAVPELDGERYRGTRALTSTYNVPLTVVADNISSLRARCRSLVRALSPKRGVGTLTVATADGLTRYLKCILDARIETDPATDGEEYDARMVLGFRAFDPFWYDLEPVEKLFENYTSSGMFFPAPPYRIGASAVFSAFVETNEGDSEAWPIWTITGPGKALELRNNTSGLTLTLDYDIPPDAAVVIDTRPGQGSVEITGGVSLFAVTSGELWPLVEGDNDVSVTLLETTTATVIRLRYEPGYLGV